MVQRVELGGAVTDILDFLEAADETILLQSNI